MCPGARRTGASTAVPITTTRTGSVEIVINKADATVVVNGYTGIYDAAAHGATGSAHGVSGVDLSGDLNFGATFTDVPGGTAHWSFNGGTNYNNQNGSVEIVINKADATVSGQRLHRHLRRGGARRHWQRAWRERRGPQRRPELLAPPSRMCPVARRTGPSTAVPTTTTRTASVGHRDQQG